MKRYLLFGYDQYYPGGGWSDFIKASDDLEELKKGAEVGLNRNQTEGYRHEYYDIVDLNKMETVWSY